jgi:hypothetical protein
MNVVTEGSRLIDRGYGVWRSRSSAHLFLPAVTRGDTLNEQMLRLKPVSNV